MPLIRWLRASNAALARVVGAGVAHVVSPALWHHSGGAAAQVQRSVTLPAGSRLARAQVSPVLVPPPVGWLYRYSVTGSSSALYVVSVTRSVLPSVDHDRRARPAASKVVASSVSPPLALGGSGGRLRPP